MIAGEFAVLEPHQRLVVMAVDRFVYATLKESDQNSLTLENLQLKNLGWRYTDGKVVIRTEDRRTRFVEDAMTIVCRYLREHGTVPNNFTLHIKSELDDPSGVKYGLGSSAAVVTAVVTAVLHAFLPKTPSKELIFKLAAISHVKTQGSGSGADVAASAYGGFLQYASFQADWLKHAYDNTSSLTELLEKEWIYFSIKQIHLPEQIHICIGWTGKPASTVSLIEKIKRLKQANAKMYQQFLDDSKQAVSLIIEGFEAKDIPLLLSGVKKNRQALVAVGKNAGVELETPLLRTLSELAEQYDGAGKPSGAGGGDCGIAFVPDENQIEQLFNAWLALGIKPLSINSHLSGATLAGDCS